MQLIRIVVWSSQLYDRVDQEWSKRWFVLTTNELLCYRDSKDELVNDVDTVMSISSDTVVCDHVGSQGYAFRITVSHCPCFTVIFSNLITSIGTV